MLISETTTVTNRAADSRGSERVVSRTVHVAGLARSVRSLGAAVTVLIVATGFLLGGAFPSHAEPDVEFTPDPDLIAPLPVITPTPSNWQPKFPFPFDQTRYQVSDVDVAAQREMCQWFNAQYDSVRRQIDRLQSDRITQNGPGVISGAGSDWDYSINGLQQKVDVVTKNIDQAVDFLAPRVQALTQTTNYVGDVHFPLYEGESFYLLWQHLSNVNNGIKAHQPAWFTGPSVQRVKRWGSRIKRSHVCD